MSVQEVVRAEIRTRVKRFIWMNVVDPGGDLIEALPVPPAELQGDQLLVYNRVLDHVLPYIFGNIAIQGTSSKIIWPDVEIQIPELLFTEGGTEYASRPTFNLHVVCPALDRFRRLSGYAPLVSATFRSLCEPFAVEAMNFLKERRTSGVSTNIYLKWPRSLDLAPWIAFDFASGLNMANLSNDERTVIDRMTKRLFRTEGQKMVFQAQGEMNLQLEG
nr:MAG: coat protein [Capillovirus sp.]